MVGAGKSKLMNDSDRQAFEKIGEYLQGIQDDVRKIKDLNIDVGFFGIWVLLGLILWRVW